MKKLIIALLAVALLVVIPITAMAANSGTEAGAAGATSVASVVRLPSDANGQTRVITYSIRSTAAAHTHDATVTVGTQTYTMTAINAGAHLFVSTTGWTAGDVVVLQTPSGNALTHTWVVAVNNGNLHIYTAPPGGFRHITTTIHRMSSTTYTIAMSGTSTNQTLTNTIGVLSAPKGQPIIVTYYGGTILFVAWRIF